jgi:hypothetical protein
MAIGRRGKGTALVSGRTDSEPFPRSTVRAPPEGVEEGEARADHDAPSPAHLREHDDRRR